MNFNRLKKQEACYNAQHKISSFLYIRLYGDKEGLSG